MTVTAMHTSEKLWAARLAKDLFQHFCCKVSFYKKNDGQFSTLIFLHSRFTETRKLRPKPLKNVNERWFSLNHPVSLKKIFCLR